MNVVTLILLKFTYGQAYLIFTTNLDIPQVLVLFTMENCDSPN